MKCPACDSDSQVVDSRPDQTEHVIRRRRRCKRCRARFTTHELLFVRPIEASFELNIGVRIHRGEVVAFADVRPVPVPKTPVDEWLTGSSQ